MTLINVGPIEHLMVTVGNQPLAALASIVTLKPHIVIPIVSTGPTGTTASVAGIAAAAKELGWTGTLLESITVNPDSPWSVSESARTASQHDWFKTAHFAYTGGTKPMAWAWDSVWQPVRHPDAKAWYVADDLGQVLPDDGSASHPVDRRQHLSFKSLIAMHGWAVNGNQPNAAQPNDVTEVTKAVGNDGTVVACKELKTLTATATATRIASVSIAVVSGWQLTLVKRVGQSSQAGVALTSMAQLARSLGGNLARCVVLGGEPQAPDAGDSRDSQGFDGLLRHRRLVLDSEVGLETQFREWFTASGSTHVTSSAPKVHEVRATESIPAVPVVSVAKADGWLFVTLGLNPLAAVAATYAHMVERSKGKLPGVTVLHTNMLSDGADDEGDAIPSSFDFFLETQELMRVSLRKSLLGMAELVEFIDCGPHDSPSELHSFFASQPAMMQSASLDATGGTKALVLVAARAWRKDNLLSREPQTASLTYTKSSGNWVSCRLLSNESLQRSYFDRCLSVEGMAALHGFSLKWSKPRDHETTQAAPIVFALRAAGWTTLESQHLQAQGGDQGLPDLDIVAVKNLVSLVIELKQTTSADLAELDRTVRRSVMFGGSLALAALVSVKPEIAESLVKDRFPSLRARSFQNAQVADLVAWANEYANGKM